MPNVTNWEINPDAVPELMRIIDWAGTEAESRVERIMTAYSSTVGTASWTSAAASAALSVQIDENSPKWKNLMKVLDDLRQGVYTAAGMQMDGVEQGRSAIQAAAHTSAGGGSGVAGGGSGMAANYESRMA